MEAEIFVGAILVIISAIIFTWLLILLNSHPIIFYSIMAAIAPIVFLLFRKPDLSHGYVFKDSGYNWQRNVINFFRVRVGKLPLWLIPSKLTEREERDLLYKANLLFYEIKQATKRCLLSNDVKNSILFQCALIPMNIANSLWKLSNLRRLAAVTDGMGSAQEHEEENELLQIEIYQEMESLVGKLSELSLSLIKSEITNNNKAIQDILSGLNNSNDKLQNIISSNGIKYNNPPAITSNFYYIFIFIILIGILTVISLYAPAYALPIIVIGSLLSFALIGIFQLRKDENIKEDSFTKIVVEILRSLRFIK